jgi:CRISPR-associated protein Cas1
MLSAPGEGLIAKMDLVDLSAAEAIPVDYKRGRVPDVPGSAWEPEQVQLCAQGLILRENGYHCEGGILYFIQSRRRVSVPFDDPLVDRTRGLIDEMREMAASCVIPPPLVDSPKCPRCSLVGICLPDETRLLASQEPGTLTPGPSPSRGRGEACEVRRLVPARDDAMPLYVQEQGATIGKSGDELTVRSRQQTLRQVKLIDVSQVSIFGNVQITAQALRDLTATGVPICHFSYGGWFHALTTGLVHKNVELRIEQYAAAAAPERALRFARQFVVGKMKNCRTLLRRHLEDDGRDVLAEMTGLTERAATASEAPTLLGLEGMAAKLYFAGFARMLKGDHAFSIEGRNRRPPRDPVNALLSFVYAILVKELTIVLHTAGFDPMLGFYHRPRYGRPSLALDLAEEFRPLIADSVVLTLVNNGEVSPASFIRRAGAVALTDAGRRAVLAGIERRMDTLVTHPVFDYRISYRRVLEVQARLLGRALLGEIAEYPTFCTR